MGEKYQALLAHLAEHHYLNQAAAVLGWDQQTNMPHGAAEARANQLATLSKLAHELFTGERTARLLEDAERELAGADYHSDEASLVRVVRADYADETKLPVALVTELARVTTLAHNDWAQARATNDFKKFQPMLERLFDLARQVADHLGYQDQPYDALLNRFERGATTAQVKAIFDDHRPPLVALIRAIMEHEKAVDDSLLRQPFDTAAQRAFAEDVVRAFGFDFEHGRLDVAVHPFCTSFSRLDVRLTTRYDEKFLNPAFFGTLHEAGHGMYEQGVGAPLFGTPLESGTSLGVHESQSRMWENVVGRSRAFWTWALPLARKHFPAQFGSATADQIYRAANKVQRSFIRVEADEATYNLHIMLRFELETELLAGKLKVADLPKAWNERFEAYLGIVPPTDTLGVLQDVHWSSGLIGYFATYALGNMLAAQYYNAALRAHPSIPDDIAQGRFGTLLGWLRENIHQHGRKFTSDELTRRITGEGIQSRYYMDYLTQKYSEIYGL